MTRPKGAQFEIIDLLGRRVVGHARTLYSAGREVDRRDNRYGAPRYAYRQIQPTQQGRMIP